MNPFELPGPQFLLFYFALVVVTVAAIALARRSSEGGEPGRASLTDPYALAYLRGGPNETLRVASVALVDRGLLIPSGTTLTAKKKVQPKNELEAALLGMFHGGGEASAIFTDKTLQKATEPIRKSLADLHLVPGPAETTARSRIFLLGLALLWAVSGARLLQAFSRGRHNVGILIMLSLLAALAAAVASYPRRTARGDRLLRDARTLFSGLKVRSGSLKPHSGSSEVALLTAVFGIAMLPATGFDWAQKLFPKASSGGTSSSSCGSSCGSSSGSSGGSSCGGGGCGGGCGGCGS